MKPKALFILIFNGIVLSTYCQDAVTTLLYADSLYKRTEYNQALKEYQRFLYFAKSDKNYHVYEKIGDCFFLLKKYDNASEYFEHAFFQITNDSIRNELIFKKVNCLLLTARYYNAIAELFNISDSVKSSCLQKKNFYLGVSYFGTEKYDEAENYFIKSIDSSQVSQRHNIKDIFKHKRYLMTPDPKKAQIMSVILPGSGQLYAGDIKDGLNSLLIVAGFAVLGYVVTVKYTIIDGILTAGPWFQRYYAGGLTNAYEIAQHKREKKRNNVYQKVISIVASTH